MKLNGYRASHRNKWLFIKHNILSSQALLLLEYYADAMDFDVNHEDFGLVEVNFEDIAILFKRKSLTTVYNWHNELITKGFIKPTSKKNYYQVVCHTRYIPTGFWKGKATEYAKEEKDQPIEIILQNFGIDLQKSEKKLQ